MKKPKKWIDVYPQGTQEGNEEQSFFISLGRNPKYKFRSTKAISLETGLSLERVEEIIEKYFKKGMVIQNSSDESQWAYWERVPEILDKKNKDSLSQSDQKDRVKDSLFAQDKVVKVFDANVHFVDTTGLSPAKAEEKIEDKMISLNKTSKATRVLDKNFNVVYLTGDNADKKIKEIKKSLKDKAESEKDKTSDWPRFFKQFAKCPPMESVVNKLVEYPAIEPKLENHSVSALISNNILRDMHLELHRRILEQCYRNSKELNVDLDNALNSSSTVSWSPSSGSGCSSSSS